MIRMIPNMISPEIKSDAEKNLFANFQSYQSDNNYIILHSLGIADHAKHIFGEIDFVVICNKGVLCIEVKGGHIGRTNGMWEFTNRFGVRQTKHEGPFEQVQGNMQSLRNYLKKRVGAVDPLVRCQYACCVIIPDCCFENDGVDIINDILFDKSFSWTPDSIADRSFFYWQETCQAKHGFTGGTLSDDDMERLAILLRGDFQFVPSVKDTVDRTVKELCALTDEQYEVLESLSDNPRTLVSGVAGAGKTLLAMEQARRAFWEGKSVLYLCFNHNIANYVAYQFDKENANIGVTTLHALMMKSCNIEWSSDLTPDFYKEELPTAFLELPIYNTYDLLIIDEGQDLLTQVYLQCINKLIVSGINAGSWTVFYDPNQNIFNSYSELDKLISDLRTTAASWKLSVNCRNTRQIANANTLMTNIPNQGKTKVVGPNVEYVMYSDKDDESKKINAIIRSLKADGIVGGDFVVLSKYTLANPLNGLGLHRIDRDLGTIKTGGTLWHAKKNDIRFSTISAFKGLESKIVIMIDVDHFSNEDTRLLNYVAASRACAMLYVLYDSKAEQERQEMILSGFREISI